MSVEPPIIRSAQSAWLRYMASGMPMPSPHRRNISTVLSPLNRLATSAAWQATRSSFFGSSTLEPERRRTARLTPSQSAMSLSRLPSRVTAAMGTVCIALAAAAASRACASDTLRS